jgi:dTDP-4-amino-4,6-dideoxygalactose transaminase
MRDLAIDGGRAVRTRPFPTWPIFGKPEEDALLRVLRSGQWGRLSGREVARFEQRFAAFQGARHALATVSGTTALRIALLAAGVEAGQEVIVPPYTFIATAEAVIEANAMPVFADIEPQTYNLDPKAVEAAVTDRTRAILPVHLGGLCADMDAMMAVAARHGLVVIEDAAHAHGATYNGRGAGTLGHMGCFSFQSSKNLTSGEGGAVLSDDEKLHAACHQIHNCGRAPTGPWYGHASLGANHRMTEFQAAVLNAQLDRLADQAARRDANGRYLAGLLADVPGVEAQALPNYATRHAYHLFLVRFDESAWGVPRGAFVRAVQAEGIPLCEGYTLPLYRQPVFLQQRFGPYTGYRLARPEADFAAFAGRCPVAEHVTAREGTWLPQQALLGPPQDMDDIAEAIAKVYRGRDALRARAQAAGAEGGR